MHLGFEYIIDKNNINPLHTSIIMEITSLLWKKLPTEIFNFNILPYIYNFQITDLLEDIRSYHTTINLAKKYYYSKIIIEWGEEEPEDSNWIMNDIGRFINNDSPIIEEYSSFFFSIWDRSFAYQHFTKNKNEVEKASYTINMYFSKNTKKSFHQYWGLMTAEEREEFINMFCFLYRDIYT